MIEAHFNAFDAGVIAVVGISTLVAFFRGFVKEVLSLGAWVGAALVTLYFFPSAAAKLQPHFKNTVVATGFATLGVYIVSLLIFSMINKLILRFVKEGGDVGMLDNTFGLIFGAARGAFVVSLGFLLMTMMLSEDEYPDWVKEAETKQMVERGAITLARVAPEYLKDISTLHKKVDEQQAGSQDEEGRLRRMLSHNTMKEDPAVHRPDEDNTDSNEHDDKGYTPESQQQMDRLLDSVDRNSAPAR
jgi:membrane protein required for colicin V production